MLGASSSDGSTEARCRSVGGEVMVSYVIQEVKAEISGRGRKDGGLVIKS